MESQCGHQLGRTDLPIGALTPTRSRAPGGPFRATLVRVLRWWLDRQIRAGLDGVFVAGRENLEHAMAEGPVVVACSHQSWWDGLIVAWLAQRWKLELMVAMRADNLERWPFFEAFGAVGIAGSAGIRQCVARLQKPGDLLWTFPQGTYRDPGTRPLGLQRGSVWIARQAGAVLLPVALGYRFGQQPRVRALMSMAAPIPMSRDRDPDTTDARVSEELESALIGQLERIQEVSVAVTAGPPSEAETVLREAGFVSADEVSSSALGPPRPDLASRLLGWVWRWS